MIIHPYNKTFLLGTLKYMQFHSISLTPTLKHSCRQSVGIIKTTLCK